MKVRWAVAVLALVAGCGSHGAPDAFGSGVPHSRLLMDRVDCDPTPDTCTRYVILGPVGTSTASLLQAVTQRASHFLRWSSTRSPEVVDPDEGRGFDGPGNSGGFINTATDELHYWKRTGYSAESPPNPTLRRAQELMRAHPDAVVVRIDA